MKVKRYLNTDLGLAFLGRNRRYYIIYRGKKMYLHQAVYIASNGELSEREQIHHIDGNRYNNHIDNLVAVSPEVHKELHKYGTFDEGDYEVEIVKNNQKPAKREPPIILTRGKDNLDNLDKYDEIALEYY